MRHILPLLLSLTLTSCALSSYAQWAADQPRSFRVPADSSAVVWGRALDYIAATGQVELANDVLIRSEVGCNFTVTRKPLGDSVEIVVIRAEGMTPEHTGDCLGDFFLTVRDAIGKEEWGGRDE